MYERITPALKFVRSKESMLKWIDFDHYVEGLATSLIESGNLTQGQVIILFRAAQSSELDEAQQRFISEENLGDILDKIKEEMEVNSPGFISEERFERYIDDEIIKLLGGSN
ncbi:MAG: hypothetical protein ACMG57_02250 [Candidatus Dojkabacteria bacterium]